MKKSLKRLLGTSVLCAAVIMFASGFGLGDLKAPAKVETVKLTLSDVSKLYGVFAGGDLDPFKEKSAEIIKSGKPKYDDFFLETRKLLMTHAFAKKVVEQAAAKKAAGAIPVQEAAAAAAIGVTYKDIEKRALELAEQAPEIGASAKSEFSSPADAPAGVKIAASATDTANELKNAVSEIPKLLADITELASVK